MTAAATDACCRACAHFRNGAAFLEAAFAGLTSLSSGHASVRGEDGLCLRHDRYLAASSWCRDFKAAGCAHTAPGTA
jgi:hypothetical protein